MLKFVINELIKIFKRPGTYVMLGILIFLISITAAFLKYNYTMAGNVPDNQDWVQGLQMENQIIKRELENSEGLPNAQREYMENSILINSYRINHNISPNEDYSSITFISEASQFIELVGLFTIIIAGGIVASEFNWGTIKLLLVRPIKRSKILASKFIAVVLFALIMVSVLLIFSSVLGVLLFGVPESPTPHLFVSDGVVQEQAVLTHIISRLVLKSVSMFMLATMAFMISAVFRNSSLAIGLSIFLMFVGSQVTLLIAQKFEWAKYLLFANTDLIRYLEGAPMVEGMTMQFSIVMLIIYFGLFLILSVYFFQKRDVAA